MDEVQMLHPQELDGMLNDKDFHALPFEQRKDVSERGISAASAYIARNVGWTPERWQQFGALAQQTRGQVQDSETMLETAGRYAGVAGKTIKELPAIIGTGALGLSPVLPDGKPGAGVVLQVPGETLGPALGRNIVSLVASGAAMLSDKEQPLVKQLGGLKEEIDRGDFLNHKDGFNGWIDERNKDLQWTQGEFYGDKDWAAENSLLGNEENAKLLQGYLVNRSPQAWAALQDNLLKTPFMAKLAADKVALENDTKLGQALKPEVRGLISEVADPAEVMPGLLVAKQGMKAVAKGATKMQRAGDLALGVGGEMVSEQVSATMDNPYMTLEQRLQVAKDSLAGALGLMGAGGAVQAGVNKLTGVRNANDGISSSEANAAAAPTAGFEGATAGQPMAAGAAENAGETEQDVQQREGTLPPPTAEQLNRRPVEVGGVPMLAESELSRIARQAGRIDALDPAPPGASTPGGVNAPSPAVPPAAVNPAPATATDPNAAPTVPPAATDLSAVADGVNLEADGTGRVLASRPVMPADRLSPLAAAAATLQSQRGTAATPQPAVMSPEVPTSEAPSRGALGDIGGMSPQNIDWALTNLDGRGRQEALGVGMQHYSQPVMSKEWYDYLAARVQTAEALSELNTMYREMNPQAKVVTKALPQAELRQGDIGALTAEQAAWILTRTDGRNRQEALGVGMQHYSDPTMARQWAQFLAEKVKQNPEAMGELEGMYREMLPDAPRLAGAQPQAGQITNGANLLAAAHAAATASGSTQWAPIKAVYEQALRLQPGLEMQDFLQLVQELDGKQQVYLEPANTQQMLDEAQGFVVASQSGPAVNMTMAPARVSMSKTDRASKAGSGNTARGRVNERQAAESVANLQRTAPALAERVRILRDREALQQGQYHADDWSSFAGPSATEAFFDPSTGETVVMLDNLVVRPGETPQRAVVRAILHERVGHAGLAAVRQGNPAAAARWQKLVEAAAEDPRIGEELAALRERGYENLNDEELVEEWFARQVELRTPEQLQALTPQSGLLGKLWQWLKDATRYVARGFSRQNWTTRELQEMMRLSREALERGGPEGVRGDGRVKQSERMNPFHGGGVPNWLRTRLNLPRNAPFRVQALGLRALLKGSALPTDLVPLVQQSQRDIAAVNETAAQLGRDLNGAIEAYAQRSGSTVQSTHDLVARAMEEPAILAALADPVLRERTRRTRNFLDDLSQVVANFTGGELGQAILQNRGHWMRRSYAAFDPAANWNYDSLSKAAKRGAQIAGVNARQILDAARTHITFSVNAERAAQGEPAATPGEIEAIMRQLTDRNTWERNLLGNMSGNGVSKNVTSLMQRAAYHPDVAQWMRNNRLTEFDYQTVASLAVTQSAYQGQNAAHLLGAARGYLASLHPNASQGEINDMLRMRDIPAPIRALMGEERNPLKRFLGSASFQSQYIARHEQQRAMRDLGLRMGLFSAQQTGVYTEEVGDSRERNGFKIDVQVPVLNGQPVTVQRTIYTTPELAAALRATQGSSSPADLGGWLVGVLKFAGSEAKLNKVALNPDSWMVNALGNVMGLVQSGDLLSLQGWQNVARAIQLHRSGQMKNGQMLNVAEEVEQDLRRQMLARVTAAGVANAGFEISDLNAALDNRVTQFINEHDQWNSVTGGVRGAILGNGIGRSFGMAGRAVGVVLGATGGALVGSQRIQEVQRKIAEWTTGNPDRIAKLAAFYGNYEAHLTAGMAEPDAFALATKKTMNTMPDYSKLPDLMRQLSRLGVAGSFIGFQHEVYRNAYHNARYAVQELRSGNAPLVARGARRLFGLSSLLTLSAWGLSGIIRGLFSSGVDDDKDEAYRRALGADHERFGNLAYTKLDKDGASFFNTSYMLPQVTLFEVIKAGIEGRDLGESLRNLGGQLSDQFLEGSVHLDPLLSAWFNATDFGKVSEEQGVRNVAERLDYLLYNMMEPGALNKGDRMVRAMTGQSRYGRTFSLEEEALKLLGVRQNSYTHEKRISSQMFRFRDEYASARAAARKVHAQRPNSAESLDALARSNARIEALQGNWDQFQRDLKTIGVPTNEIERIRKATGTARTYPKLEMGDKGPESERARTVKIDAMPSSEEANRARGLVRVK